MKLRPRHVLVIGVLAVAFVLLILPFLIPLDSSGQDPRSLADPEGQFIDVNGLQTYVIDTDPDAADTLPVVFIHGLFGSTYTWRHSLNALRDADGLRGIAFDRPGAGLSAKPIDADYSHPAHADFSVALLDALGIERAVIVGHSAGGSVAAHLALRHPDRVAALVLVDAALIGASGPPPFIGALVGFPPIQRWGRIGAQALLTEDSVRQTVASFHADAGFVTEADYAAYLRTFQTPDWDAGFIGLVRDSGPNRLSEDDLAGISVPTQLLWGGQDTWTPLDAGERLAVVIPGASLTVLPLAGHQPMEEAAADFNTALLRAIDAAQAAD